MSTAYQRSSLRESTLARVRNYDIPKLSTKNPFLSVSRELRKHPTIETNTHLRRTGNFDN